MKVLEIEFYLMHILFKISRRHYRLGGSYGLGRIIYTDEHDGNLRFQCNEVKSLFQLGLGLRVPSGVMAKWNCLLSANLLAIWSTKEVFRLRSTGMPPTALNINPKGKKNHSFSS